VPDSVREWLAPLLALIGGGGITALFQSWRKPSSKAEDVAAEATADQIRTEGWRSLLQSLESRLDRVEAEAEQCHRENAAFRKALAERDATIQDLTSRIKRLEGQLEARDLRDAAEALPDTFATMDGEGVTVMRLPKKGAK